MDLYALEFKVGGDDAVLALLRLNGLLVRDRQYFANEHLSFRVSSHDNNRMKYDSRLSIYPYQQMIRNVCNQRHWL